jgi:hypothetical protein
MIAGSATGAASNDPLTAASVNPITLRNRKNLDVGIAARSRNVQSRTFDFCSWQQGICLSNCVIPAFPDCLHIPIIYLPLTYHVETRAKNFASRSVKRRYISHLRFIWLPRGAGTGLDQGMV